MISGLKAVSWGQEHEADGRKLFTEQTGLSVTLCGTFLHESGLLCASPDGLVGDFAVLEIKCPFKYRGDPDFNNAFRDPSFCLFVNESGAVCLKPNHPYFDQVQGQMFLSGRDHAYFVVYIPAQTLIVCVDKDDSWASNIQCLIDFYISNYFPFLLASNQEQ